MTRFAIAAALATALGLSLAGTADAQYIQRYTTITPNGGIASGGTLYNLGTYQSYNNYMSPFGNVILLALLARERLGRGQNVEVALIDTAVAMTAFYGMAYLISGANPGRFGNSPNGSPTVGIYKASDGPFYMACANDRLYRRLVTDVLARPDLVTDPEFAQRKNRSANKEKLRGIIAGVFAGDRRENWMAKMKKANIPVGYLRTVEEGFNAPEVRDRHRLSHIPHPTAGSVPNIETPLHMSLTPTIDPVAAPLLGEHTKEVLRKTLGYDDRRIAALAEAGAFGKTGNSG